LAFTHPAGNTFPFEGFRLFLFSPRVFYFLCFLILIIISSPRVWYWQQATKKPSCSGRFGLFLISAIRYLANTKCRSFRKDRFCMSFSFFIE